jgi:hypothetical protein
LNIASFKTPTIFTKKIREKPRQTKQEKLKKISQKTRPENHKKVTSEIRLKNYPVTGNKTAG